MDKYEKAALDFKAVHPMMGELEGFLSVAFRWYDFEREKEWAKENRMHESYTDAMLQEKREKGK